MKKEIMLNEVQEKQVSGGMSEEPPIFTIGPIPEPVYVDIHGPSLGWDGFSSQN